MQTLVQPRQRKAYIAIDAGRGHSENPSRLFYRAPQKIAQLDGLRLGRAELLEFIEGARQVDRALLIWRHPRQLGFEGNAGKGRAALGGPELARVIDEQ